MELLRRHNIAFVFSWDSGQPAGVAAAYAGQADASRTNAQLALQNQQQQLQAQQQQFQQQQSLREYDLRANQFQLDRQRQNTELDLRRQAQAETTRWHNDTTDWRGQAIESQNQRASNSVEAQNKRATDKLQYDYWNKNVSDAEFQTRIGVKKEEDAGLENYRNALVAQGDQRIVIAKQNADRAEQQGADSLDIRKQMNAATIKWRYDDMQRKLDVEEDRNKRFTASYWRKVVESRIKDIETRLGYKLSDAERAALIQERMDKYNQLGQIVAPVGANTMQP